MKYTYRQIQTTIDAGDKVVDELNRMGESGFRVIDVTKSPGTNGGVVVYLVEKAE